MLSLTQSALGLASGCSSAFRSAGGRGRLHPGRAAARLSRRRDNPHVAIGTSAIAVALNAAANLPIMRAPAT